MSSMSIRWCSAVAKMSTRLATCPRWSPTIWAPRSRPSSRSPVSRIVILRRSGVVDLVIPRLELGSERIESRLGGLSRSQPGACHREVEDLHHLGTEAPVELPLTTHRVLACDAPLLVRGRSERHVGGALKKTMPGLHAIPGGEDVGQVGPHHAVRADRLAQAEFDASILGQRRVRPDAHHHQDDVGRGIGESITRDDGRTVCWRDPSDERGGPHLHPMRAELLFEESAEFGVDRRHDGGRLLKHGDRHASTRERIGHLQPDVAATHDHRRAGTPQALVEREGVIHRVEQVHPFLIHPLDGWADRQGSCADNQPVIGARLLDTVGTEQAHRLRGGIDLRGTRVESKMKPARLDLFACAMRELMPIGRFPAQEERDPADAEVRVRVGHDHRDLGGGVKLPSPKRRADPRIASPDDEKM